MVTVVVEQADAECQDDQHELRGIDKVDVAGVVKRKQAFTAYLDGVDQRIEEQDFLRGLWQPEKWIENA